LKVKENLIEDQELKFWYQLMRT